MIIFKNIKYFDHVMPDNKFHKTDKELEGRLANDIKYMIERYGKREGMTIKFDIEIK